MLQIKVGEGLNKLAKRLRPYVPFTALNTVWRNLDKQGQSVLDVGCGKGEPMAFLNRHNKFKTVGIDIFKPYLEEARRRKVHQNLILGDVRYLPFKDESFDVAMSIEVLEHLEKGDGERLLSELERVTRGQVLLTTPVGKYEQHTFEGNPHWEHK